MVGPRGIEGLLRVAFGRVKVMLAFDGVGGSAGLDDHVDVGADLGDDGEDAGGDARCSASVTVILSCERS